MQRKEPGRFSHQPGEQGLPSAHSFTSAAKKAGLGLRPIAQYAVRAWGFPMPRMGRPLSLEGLAPNPVWSRTRPIWEQLGAGSLSYTFEAPPSYPLGDPDPALTAAGPAPLAAVAGLTGNALEAPGFVLAFAIRAGARVSALVDVCTGGRRRTF